MAGVGPFENFKYANRTMTVAVHVLVDVAAAGHCGGEIL